MQDSYMKDVESIMDVELGNSDNNFTDDFSISTPQTLGASYPSPFVPSLGTFSNAGLPLSQEEQASTMQTVLGVFELDERDPADGDEELLDPEAEVEDRRFRTERLKAIGSALDALWWSNNDQMAAAAEKLANGSRDSRWRIPIGDCGLLDAFLMIIASEGMQEALLMHALRLIGNSCADTDENRARVISHKSIPAIIALMKNDDLVPFVIPVLFNILVDYEPAQKVASESRLSQALIELISRPSFMARNRAFLGYVCKLLDLIVTQPNEAELAPQNTASKLLSFASHRDYPPDVEDYVALVSSALNYLQSPRFQIEICNTSGLDSMLWLLLTSYTRLEVTTVTTDSDNVDENQLDMMRRAMNQTLSDISALPEFAARCPVVSPRTSSLRRWLTSPQIQLQVCACIMLGNLARSDSACIEFVFTSAVHKPLINILSAATDPQLLHAALGFLKNLALPTQNKSELGNADLISVLPRLWSLDSLPNIQYSAISLARQLIIGNFENVQRINRHLSPDPDSPAYSKSRLSILISVFQRTDAEPVKMEIARLLTAMCRVFASPTVQIPDLEERAKKFFARHPDIGRPLAFMVSQRKWPIVRSEGWFVLALMARSEEGSRVVADIMHDVDVFQPLVELLTGKRMLDGSVGPTTNLLQSSSSSPPTGSSSSPTSSTSPRTDSNQRIDLGIPDFSAVINSSHASPENNMSNSPITSSSPIDATINNNYPGLSSSEASKMSRIDRENGLVLVSELLRNRGEGMASMRRSVFEDLLKGGGVLHMGFGLSSAQVREREEFFDARLGSGSPSGVVGTNDGNGGKASGGGSADRHHHGNLQQVVADSHDISLH